MDEGNQLSAPSAIQRGGALVDIEQQRAIAETQAAMIMAKKFPRDVAEAIKRVTESCKRIGLADQAVYEYARGGTEITGPSIRLAEAIAQCWGNLQYGIRELSQAHGESTVEAFAWDVENNTRQIKIFHVSHRRHTKKGGYALTDPRDIYELVANNGARRLRACILGTIPGDVIETALKQCEKTILDNVDLSVENVNKMIVAFERFDVNKTMIEKRLQRKIEAITARNVLSLRRIFNALSDGMGKGEDYFDMELKTSDAVKPREEEPKKSGGAEKPEKQPSKEEKPKAAVTSEPAPKKEEPKPEVKEEPEDEFSDIPNFAKPRQKEDTSTGALPEEKPAQTIRKTNIQAFED